MTIAEIFHFIYSMQISLLEMRLAGTGSSANQGRVEVYLNGQWGTVCSDLWGLDDADVVCRQLGFPGASGFTVRARTFGEGSGPIFLDNVRCVGDETSINDCVKNAIGFHNCLHSDDAGVICQLGKSRKCPNKICLVLLLRYLFFHDWFRHHSSSDYNGGGGVKEGSNHLPLNKYK